MITYSSEQKIFYPTRINDSTYFSGFSTSDLGDSRNLEKITGFFAQQGINYKKLVTLEQIHSTNIAKLPDLANQIEEDIKDADGVLTNLTESILIIRNADCVPLIITDKTTGYIGISHQGWRGSLKNMSAKMVSSFIKSGSEVKNLVCAIGPAIGACCYDVDDDHYYEFLESYEEYANRIFFKRKNRWHISLNHLNYLQLIRAGVKKENIDFFPFCTKCDSKRFFSRRRAKSSYFEEMFNFVVKI